MSDMKWYVVHTYSGYENKVAMNIETVVQNRGLQDLIHEVRVPRLPDLVSNLKSAVLFASRTVRLQTLTE